MTSTAYSCTNDNSSHVFSMFLKQIRHENDLSQEQFCLRLREESSLFCNLDSITISRWEREVNIPSLAKQAEIVELFGKELFDVYGNDHQFISEGIDLVNYEQSYTDGRSIHPYYKEDSYTIEKIGVEHHCFLFFLRMILQYEGNPSIELVSEEIIKDEYASLNIMVACAYGNQVVGHCLYLDTSTHEILKLLNFKSGLQQVITSAKGVNDDSLLVLSSFGATSQIENSMMSIYINKFACSKPLRYLCFSLCDETLIKKLTAAKLTPFKEKLYEKEEVQVTIVSFLISRSEVMANRFLLKLAVISASRLNSMLNTMVKGG
ncbi:helix-turn-helix transcriptional regulator [Shewanella nanhaiensis]|uniref:Helix-turn-helix domain-containing protein n=1 Tax=Shewanella nanhaiensis TaxID=2864872 RepID=A0ABS7EAD7_9GAMM|nr:helix-turn-helix transcriptional regulator [Shewanella nanhaiensis]MBW8186298.1 helix-turn-helix domain-containing protein [Shewanella nanhaiensis]